jgi:predicted TIM-barrel fold metal-dependent hydrolase
MRTNRRQWIRSATTALAPALVPSLLHGQVKPALPATRIIDTHTHFYDPTRPQGVPWPPKGTDLYRKVMPDDWKARANPLGIRETVVIEASQWVEDNQWQLDLAEREPCIVGVIGNLDPNDAQFSAHLDRFAKNRLFRGIRWRGDLVRVDSASDAVVAGAKALSDRGLTLDLNGNVDMLPQAAALAAKAPDLKIVIDHLGAPGDPRRLNPAWKDAMRRLAEPNKVFVKVSALVEQVPNAGGNAPDDAEFYRPILDHLWECFGPGRLIYGSNWPVSDKGAPYSVVFKIVRDYFTAKGPEAAEQYFWKNSLLAYQWVGRH